MPSLTWKPNEVYEVPFSLASGTNLNLLLLISVAVISWFNVTSTQADPL